MEQSLRKIESMDKNELWPYLWGLVGGIVYWFYNLDIVTLVIDPEFMVMFVEVLKACLIGIVSSIGGAIGKRILDFIGRLFTQAMRKLFKRNSKL